MRSTEADEAIAINSCVIAISTSTSIPFPFELEWDFHHYNGEIVFTTSQSNKKSWKWSDFARNFIIVI